MRRVVRLAVWLLALLLGLFILLQAWFAGQIVWWRTHAPRETSFMSMRLSDLRDKDPQVRLRYQFVAYPQISEHLKRAMIAAEDAKFVEHEGFDWDGIQQAMDKNMRKGHVVAGGSTITQQLAKNLFLSAQKSYVRKGEEAIITIMLENLLDKERIFELYLNVIEWGTGIFGCEAAAHRYFSVTCAQLSAPQAARLAAMAPNPRFYERNPNARGLARKTSIILARMPSSDLP